ncbi:MAG: hypothetical protein K9G60_12720 [Pseudolabrys sp.]|nr:hypothetical protein [Pseudolabrys sp.]
MTVIRSFLIDFGPARPSGVPICANFFCVVYEPEWIGKNQNKIAATDQKYFRLAFAAEYHTRKKPLFHRMFFTVGIFAPTARRVRAQSIAALRSIVPVACFGDEFASLTHTMK